MSIQSGARRQSWRQSSARTTKGRGSVRRRQVLTTALLTVFLVAAIVLVFLWFNSRYQHTRVGTLLTASPTKTSEPEQAFTWLPLRFGSESLAPLLAESTEQFQVTSLTSNFDDAQELERAVEEQIARLQRDDAFILWIRAKGAEFDGRAYLLSGNYRLPASGEELSSPRGAVPFKTIVDAVSQWSGPVLILLDWGNQLCDPRAGMWENQFLSLVVEEIQTAPPQVNCLVSHQTGELSLDSLTNRQTLFGRACAEGIVGPRRLPPGTRSDVWRNDKLLVGDLAEYVIRRVWTDSAQRQKPWLIQGQTGWVSADRQNWLARTQLSLGELNQHHRLLGWSELPTTAETPGAESGTGAAQAAMPTDQPTVTAGVELNDENWPTGKLWKLLDQWRAPTPALGGWSLAALAPLSAKRMATMALDLEHRWLAGTDFRGEVDGVGLRSRIDTLYQSLQQEATKIERAAQASSFAAVLAGRPNDVSAVEFSNWLQRVDTLAAFRQLGLVLSDAIGLSDNLAKRDDGSSELRQATGTAIGKAKSFLRDVTTTSGESIDELRLTDAALLARELKSQLADIDSRVADLVTRATSNSLAERPLAELLSRYCWLSYSQRNALLLAMLSDDRSDPNASSLTMALELMQATPPQYVESKQLIAPQRVSLIEAVMTGSGDGSGPMISTPAEVVTLLGAAASSLSEAGTVTEAAWLMVDGRDLCQKESGWSSQQQLPPLPAVPQPQAGWRVAWENVVGAQLGSDRLQLFSTSEAASVDFLLTRIGSAADIESVQIQLTGLEGRIAGDDAGWQRGVLKLSQADLLRVVDLKANAQRLPLELRAQSADQQTRRGVQIQVEAGHTSPPLVSLTCQLPVDTPVVVRVQQRVCRDGNTDWEDCDRQGTLTTLTPFPGRKTQYRILVSNQDSQSRTATIELYRLPSRARTNAKGRISETAGEIPPELIEQSLRSFSLIATSASIRLEPNMGDQEVDFAPAAAASASPAAASPAVAEGAPSSAADIAWGMLAVVRLESEPTRDDWRNWIQLRPVAATDFLMAQSSVSSDARSIEMQIGFKDTNRDGVPDWTPTDFSDEQPIALDCEVGGGIDLRRATFPMPHQNLTKDQPRQVFTISTERRIEDEVELQVTVDGAARALFEFVGVGGRAARREPPDRIKLRSIGVKDGVTYRSDFHRNLAENERYLDSNGAMFKHPVSAPLEMVLAVDAESRSRVGAHPEAVEFTLVWPTGDQPIPIGRVFGDRDLTATLAGSPGKTLTIECQLSDWKFTFSPRTLGDVEASFTGSIGRVRNQVLGKLVLDGREPVLAQPVRIEEITEGQNGQVSFQVMESVPIGQGTVKVGPEGREILAEPNGEKLSAADFVPARNGWQLRSRTLKVQDRPPGRYDVRVQLADVLGNSAELGPWTLVIKAKPQPLGPNGVPGASATPLTGDINGRLFFGNFQGKSPTPVTVKVKDMPDKTAISSDGKFTITGLDAGEYTLEATTEWQGVIYKGEAKVKLIKKADYQKLIDISLNK